LFDPRADLDPAMPALFAAALGLLCVALLLSVVWLIQLRTRNAGMVDPAKIGVRLEFLNRVKLELSIIRV